MPAFKAVRRCKTLSVPASIDVSDPALPLPFPASTLIDPLRAALFLDFDGTLVAIADQPDQVRVSPHLRDLLALLSQAANGALAIVTGRDIADVDAYLAPLRLPIAGVHGLVRRTADGRLDETPSNGAAIATIEARLQPFVSAERGLLLERKTASIALHYRARPDLEKASQIAIEKALGGVDSVTLVRGKMVFEAKAGTAHKGQAVDAYMNEAPFAGRVPFFAGDDRTDEDAFSAVNARGGVTVKIGTGTTKARYRIDGQTDFIDWLDSLRMT